MLPPRCPFDPLRLSRFFLHTGVDVVRCAPQDWSGGVALCVLQLEAKPSSLNIRRAADKLHYRDPISSTARRMITRAWM